MALPGHTCGISAAVPGMLRQSHRVHTEAERMRGQGREEGIPNTWEGRAG